MKTKFKTEEQIRKEVANLPRKDKNLTSHFCIVEDVVSANMSVDSFISFLNEQKREAALKLSYQESNIKIRASNSYWSTRFSFYGSRPETDEEYVLRQARSLKQRMANFNKRQRAMMQREERAKAKRTEILTDIISNFGEEEIYEVFKTITNG